MVIRIEAVVFCQQDVQACLHVQVLEGVIHQNEVGVGQGAANAPDALHTVFIHGNGNKGEFFVYLQRLVTDDGAVRLMVSKTESFGAPSIASADYSQCMIIAEHFNEVFDMGGFAGSACAQVADVDGRYPEADTVSAPIPIVITASELHQNGPNRCHNHPQCIS